VTTPGSNVSESKGSAGERPAIRAGSRLLLLGGNGGIGSKLAERATELGAHVISLDTPSAIAERPFGHDILCLPLDAEDPATIRASFEQVGKQWETIDGFVFLAGLSPPRAPLMTTSLSDWDSVMSVNLRAAFVAFQLVLPLMKRPGGSIVAVSSGLAVNVEPGFGPYSASKAGLIALAKVLAKEAAPDVRVNIVAPGMVDTPFLAGGTGRPRAENVVPVEETEFFKVVKPSILLGRIATPDDVVDPILFLLGNGSRYMTGQTIHINAGRYMP
jgi:3-oxoacyl-[acyl-carrier protein] reductase